MFSQGGFEGWGVTTTLQNTGGERDGYKTSKLFDVNAGACTWNISIEKNADKK